MPPWSEEQFRQSRRYAIAQEDQRYPFERDRDRVLYSSAFRRLGGITQVARAGDQDVFHNRLTHTIKVAQIGRRIAQDRLRAQPTEAAFHGLDPEVVEAACLAHDLGHPPFGHLGEKTLNALVLKDKEEFKQFPWDADPDGYEGNAQSFRIIASLALRFAGRPGLDLTRSTLAACIKYPWQRDPNDSSKNKKWGYYDTEAETFKFARDEFPGSGKTAEAELMDWSDDVAYSVHDLEDFHRGGAIPWLRIFSEDEDRNPVDLEILLQNATSAWHNAPGDAEGRLRSAYRRLRKLILTIGSRLLTESYEGTPDQRISIRTLTSHLIGRYIRAIRLTTQVEFENSRETVNINENMHDEVMFLKQITRDYIISRPSLAAQQRGQRKIIIDLFQEFYREISTLRPSYIPKRFHHVTKQSEVPSLLVRLTADCIASLTESEFYALHGRLFGYASGSILDPIVR